MTDFQINEIIDVEEFQKEILEDMSDLTLAMRTQTARAAYYGVMLSQARTQASKVDLITKSLEAKLSKRYRKELTEQMALEAEAAGVKKPERVTIDMVKAEVALDPTMLAWENKRLHAEEIKRICQVAYEAFKTRQDMIISLGHMTRAEMNSQLKSITNTVSENRDLYNQRRALRNGGSDNIAQETSA